MPAPSSTTATPPIQPTPQPTQQPALPDARSQRSRRQGRGDGQWALGYREPLNKNEELKKNDDGLNVRDRIINVYAKPKAAGAGAGPRFASPAASCRRCVWRA